MWICRRHTGRAATGWAAILFAAVAGGTMAGDAAFTVDTRKQEPARNRERPKPAPDVEKLLTAFRKEPGKENFLRVRAAVIAAPTYDPYSRDLDEIGDLVQQKQFAKVQARLKAAMPNLLLSPRAHLYAFQAAEGLGDARIAESERSLLGACFKGILSTGDGSRDKPYLVTRVSDEYDVLARLGKKSKKQSLVREGEKRLDRFDCADGSVLWFDVTEVFGSLKRRPSQK